MFYIHFESKIKNEDYRVSCSSYPGKIVFSAKNPDYLLHLKTLFQMEFLNEKMLFNFFIALCEDHSEKEISLCYKALEKCVDKLNDDEFDLLKSTEDHLVKAVFRQQK